MRLVSLKLAGFRGFAGEASVDLDADAVILIGVNGNGKTSLLDAILWALCGRVPRLGGADENLVSRFSETGQAQVEVRLRPRDGGDLVVVTRTFSGEGSVVAVATPKETYRGPAAEAFLIAALWPEAAAATSPADALAAVLTRSTYLQQDLVRQFIDSATEQERFSALSELVGAGRVTDFQVDLERAKVAWTKATNVRAAELQPLRSRLQTMDGRLSQLRDRQAHATGLIDDAAWSKLSQDLSALGFTETLGSLGSREAAGAIDRAVGHLESARRVTERRFQLVDALKRDVLELDRVPLAVGAPELQGEIATLNQRLEAIQAKLATEQARISEVRRQQGLLREQQEQLQALASLALHQLGERCPVCEQSYDIEGTRARLTRLAAPGSATAGSLTVPDLLPELLAERASLEKELVEREATLRGREQENARRSAVRLAIEKRLIEFGMESGGGDQATLALNLERQAGLERARIEALAEAQRRCESFAMTLSLAADVAAVKELEKETEATRAKLREEDTELARRAATGEQAQRVIEALREAASDVVTQRIKEIEPLLSDMYGRIDVHPAFRVVRFLASVVRGRGQLSTVVEDPISGVECDAPGLVLSSSQMNALAVCVFLSINVGLSRPPLETAILDDPLQSLDDINLLGLIDLLRRTKDRRQLCVSTHDLRFGDLLARKLRPRSQDQRTIVVQLDGWSRRGPVVTIRDSHSDPAPIRLAAS
jgi:DNA repair exonuclease SbcCD ATPase subunit